MSAARLAPLLTLLEHEERERDVVRARALDARGQAQHARAQAQDLERYRTEQGQRWAQRFRTQGTPEILRCHHSFMLRLDHAVTQQSAAATHAEQRAENVADVLRAHEQRVAAVRKLIERQQQSMRVLEQRAEQRREDEFAMRVGAANRAFGATAEHEQDVALSPAPSPTPSPDPSPTPSPPRGEGWGEGFGLSASESEAFGSACGRGSPSALQAKT